MEFMDDCLSDGGEAEQCLADAEAHLVALEDEHEAAENDEDPTERQSS